MNARRCRWLQLQKAMWLLVFVATVSMVITLHMDTNFIWFKSKSNEIPCSSPNKQESDHVTLPRPHSNVKASHVTQDQLLIGNFKLSFRSPTFTINNGDKHGEKGINVSDLIAEVSLAHGLFQHGGVGNFLRTTIDHSFNRKYINKTDNHINISRNDVILHSKSDFDSGERRTLQIKENELGNVNTSEHESRKALLPEIGLSSRKSQGYFMGTLLNKPDLSTIEIIYNKISQVEKCFFFAKSVVVAGTVSSVRQHLPLFEAAFRKYKIKVTYQVDEDKSTHRTGECNRCLVFCLGTSCKKDKCVLTSRSSILQKVNIILEMMPLLTSPWLLCDLAGDRFPEKTSGQWYGGKTSCYALNSKYFTTGSYCDGKSGWLMLSKDNHAISRQYITCNRESLPFANLTHRKDESILVPLANDLLTIDGSDPLVWQVKVLVTSLLPPRVYLHPTGLAWHGLQDFINHKRQKNVSLLELRQLITELSNESTADRSLTRLQSTIMEVVRLLEKHISATRDYQRPCQKSFQLLAVVLVFDSSFQPSVLEVVPNIYSEHLTSLSDYLLEQNILEDLAAMLMSRETISVDLIRAFYELGVTHVRNEKICIADKNVCFGEDDITYLLDTRREQRAARNWIRLFPSTAVTCTQILQALSGTPEAEHTSSLKPISLFEKFALSVEEHFLCPLARVDTVKKSGLDFPVHGELDDKNEPFTGKLSNISKLLVHTCQTDDSSLVYLSAIHTDPYIQLFPEFSPLVTEYLAYADYQTTVVQIYGVTRHCGTQAKLNNMYSSSRATNFTLGLGENTANILVVGMDHLKPYILNIYKVMIHRRRLGQNLGRFDPLKEQYYVCSFKQDCSLPFSLNSSCGLQPVFQELDWKEYWRYQQKLPSCGAGSVPGEWMVPCYNCHNESSCHWHKAVWQPSGCQERQLSSDELKSCFAGKKVLFLGDSTNRGILHYILERLNGSLNQWDKTHNICIYPDLNDGQTMFSFAYYPQFWLTSTERPAFNETIYHLLNKTSDWSSKDTVIVLGGVHWLAKNHLNMLAEGLQRESLSKSRVIVKGLGAGFHQQVSGLRQLSLGEQQHLSSNNQAVLSHAHQLGFSTVDTFSMTMARYRDFLQGECACHFHQISAVQPSVLNKLSWKSSVPVDYNIKYHVEGDINSVYSEMVINRICADIGG